jgi:hypothetical protein
MNTEKFEGNAGWRTLWLAIAGVMAITLAWNVLMLSLNGISYWCFDRQGTNGAVILVTAADTAPAQAETPSAAKPRHL